LSSVAAGFGVSSANEEEAGIRRKNRVLAKAKPRIMLIELSLFHVIAVIGLTQNITQEVYEYW
jgi:hypothetical protein